MENKGKKVFVAMSGGVDSSVSAVLLKEEGYDVTGVFMNVWQPDFLECSRGDDRREAMRVAAYLDIPFQVFDFEKEYKEKVVDYMVREYKEGRTPNPDVACNKHIKFGLFFKKAIEQGAEYIATGHYARTNEKGELFVGVDVNKDQSYFLWTLSKNELQKTLFPVGELEKKEVRTVAKKNGLPNAERKESQGVCFLGEFDMKEFLSHYIEKKEGNVLNEKGEVIGVHEGAFFLTIGQRHGFTITKKTPHDEPYYIIAKNVDDNTITVSYKGEQEKFGEKDIFITKTSFVSGETPREGGDYLARIRYRQKLQFCKVTKIEKDRVLISFNESQKAVSKGQSLVLYDGEMCLGGGVIV